MVTQSLGSAAGTQVLTASAGGNVVAGVSQLFYGASETATVTIVNTATNKVTGQFTYSPPTGDILSPLSLALNPAGTIGYLGLEVLYAQSGTPTFVAALNLPTGTVNQVFPILPGSIGSGQPFFLTVFPDGSALLSLVNLGPALDELCNTSLSPPHTARCLDLAFFSKIHGTLGTTAYSFAVSSDGAHAYIPIFENIQPLGKAGLFLIEADLSSMTISRTLEIPGPGPQPNGIPNVSVAYCSATGSVYLGNAATPFNDVRASIMRVDLGSYTVAVTQPVNYNPAGIAITPDCTQLLVTGSPNGTQIFDGTSLAFSGNIVGGQQQAIVIPAQ